MPQFLQTQLFLVSFAGLLGTTRAFARDVPDTPLKKIVLTKIGALGLCELLNIIAKQQLVCKLVTIFASSNLNI